MIIKININKFWRTSWKRFDEIKELINEIDQNDLTLF